MSYDLLHTALHRHASQLRSPDGEPLSPPLVDRLALSGSDDENELVEVRTPMTASIAGSVESTPASSRSASPSRAGGGKRKGGAGKPRRDKAKEREKADQMRNPIDPFLRFPGEVLGRVLGELDVRDLQSVGLVCKRWRRSQTLSESAIQLAPIWHTVRDIVVSSKELTRDDNRFQTTPGSSCSNRTPSRTPPTAGESTPTRTASRPGARAMPSKIGRSVSPTSLRTTRPRRSSRTTTRTA